jgi:hypothetical protein
MPLPTITAQDTGPMNSCGLADVSQSLKERLRAPLQAAADDTIIRDMIRVCRCGQQSIVYAFNLQKVNKLCISCGAFESKISIVKGEP